MMRIDTDDTHSGWEAQQGLPPHNTHGTMNTLKRMIDTLGVTMEELRGGCRERRLADARTLIAAALPITQAQAAELLGCSQPAVCAMRKRHQQLLASDCYYRAKWQEINNATSIKQLNH